MRASNLDEVKAIAEFIRNAARVPGVCLLVLDADACLFAAYALDASASTLLQAIVPSKLREVADMLEQKDEDTQSWMTNAKSPPSETH